MALTPEQQAQVDVQSATQIAVENVRHANQMALQAKQAKLEAIRLAKETLIENARSKPVDAREVTAADITAFAASLELHINA
jgi:hypothetical protein